jgi:chemotaxis protein CheD
MKQYFDHRLKKDILAIDLGDVAVSGDSVYISTVLGSCVSVVLYDPETGIGGMNHFQMPEPLPTSDSEDRPCFYGSLAIPKLFRSMEEAGCRRSGLQAKIFGGSCKFYCEDEVPASGIGLRNISYAREFLRGEGIPIEREDVGGSHGRRIYFDVKTFVVYLRRISQDLRASTLP